MLRKILLCIALLWTAPVVAQEAASAQQQGGGADYTINVGDQLEIYVWGEERLQRSVRVLPDGTFSFPLIGRITAVGRGTTELETIVAEGLSDQYRGEVPDVTVTVQQTAGMQFSIVGKVNSPGAFTPNRYVNLLEAISMAGGPSEFAKLNDIVIIRRVDGQLRALRTPLSDLFRGGSNALESVDSTLPRVQSGDTIIVP